METKFDLTFIEAMNAVLAGKSIFKVRILCGMFILPQRMEL